MFHDSGSIAIRLDASRGSVDRSRVGSGSSGRVVYLLCVGSAFCEGTAKAVAVEEMATIPDGVRIRRKIRGVLAFGAVLLTMLLAGTVFLGSRFYSGGDLPANVIGVVLAFWLFAVGCCCLLWTLIVRPSLTFERDALVVRNIVTTIRIGYRLIVDATGDDADGVRIHFADGESLQPFVFNGGRYFGSIGRDRPEEIAAELRFRCEGPAGVDDFVEEHSAIAAWTVGVGTALMVAAFLVVMIATSSV